MPEAEGPADRGEMGRPGVSGCGPPVDGSKVYMSSPLTPGPSVADRVPVSRPVRGPPVTLGPDAEGVGEKEGSDLFPTGVPLRAHHLSRAPTSGCAPPVTDPQEAPPCTLLLFPRSPGVWASSRRAAPGPSP